MVADPDDVPLRPDAVRVGRGVAALRVAPLRPRPVDVEEGVLAGARRPLHPAEGAPEGDVGRRAVRRPVDERGARPVERPVARAPFVRDRRRLEERVERGRRGRVGRAPVVDEALKLLGRREPPVVVAEVPRRVLRRGEGERLLPRHPEAAVGPGPGEPRRAVEHRAVSRVDEVVRAVGRVSPDVADVHRLRDGPARPGLVLRVALDPAVGEVDAEGGRVAVHRRRDVLRRRPVLAVDDALGADAAPVDEVEGLRVEERDPALGAREPLALDAGEQDQRVELLDGRHPPVGVPADAAAGGARDGLGERHLRDPGLHPRQARDEVGRRRVAVVAVGGGAARLLRVLPVEGLTGRRAADRREVVPVAEGLPRADDGVGEGVGGACDGSRGEEEGGHGPGGSGEEGVGRAGSGVAHAALDAPGRAAVYALRGRPESRGRRRRAARLP